MYSVKHEDREAAADMMCAYRDRLTPEEQAESAMLAHNIRAGLHDDAPRVQAFAAHRQQAEDAMRERCAKVADHWSDDDAGTAWANSTPQVSIATAIRGIDAGGEGE